MAYTRKRPTPIPQPAKVRCCDCSLFIRDTTGPSFNITTGEYFMGTCTKGHADGRVFIDPATGNKHGKVFMDKERICANFKLIGHK